MVLRESFNSVGEFADYIDAKQRVAHGVVWRGQADVQWALTSSDFRARKYDLQVSKGEASPDDARVSRWCELAGPAAFAHLHENLRHLPESRNTLGPILFKAPDDLNEDEQNEVWALGQHYGLKTPLLDWSRSPYVALFFACADAVDRQLIDKDGQIAVWGLCPGLIGQILAEAQPQSHFLTFNPKLAENRRLVAQQGLFTRLSPDGDLLLRLEKVPRESDLQPTVHLITFPYNKCWDCLEHLIRMNIGFHSLYPDIEGICRFSNFAAINASYTGRVWGGVPWGYNVPGTSFWKRKH